MNQDIAINGKIPPQAIEVEEAILAGIMNDEAAIFEVSDILRPEMFYKESHQKIFTTILTLFKTDKGIDAFTITDELRRLGELDKVGGVLGITNLSMKSATAARIGTHANILKDKYIQRECIRIGATLMDKAFDGEGSDEIISFAEREMFKIGDSNIKKEGVHIFNILKTVAETIEARSKVKAELTGVPSGITELDRITLGWQPGDLIILAARPSMGKTAVAIQFAKVAAALGHGVAFFSLEMTAQQLGERYLTHETRIDGYNIKKGIIRHEEWGTIEKALSDNLERKLFIDDSASMDIFEFRSKVRRLKKKHDIKLVICDYLQLFKGDGDKNNMSEYYGSISKMFKAVGKDCGVAVIALSQLNRMSEQRGNPFPKLSDLRNSGEIEQDADLVIFPMRYDKVGMDKEDPSLKGKARMDIAKNRNGMIGDFDINVSEDCVFWGEADLF